MCGGDYLTGWSASVCEAKTQLKRNLSWWLSIKKKISKIFWNNKLLLHEHLFYMLMSVTVTPPTCDVQALAIDVTPSVSWNGAVLPPCDHIRYYTLSPNFSGRSCDQLTREIRIEPEVEKANWKWLRHTSSLLQLFPAGWFSDLGPKAERLPSDFPSINSTVSLFSSGKPVPVTHLQTWRPRHPPIFVFVIYFSLVWTGRRGDVYDGVALLLTDVWLRKILITTLCNNRGEHRTLNSRSTFQR